MATADREIPTCIDKGGSAAGLGIWITADGAGIVDEGSMDGVETDSSELCERSVAARTGIFDDGDIGAEIVVDGEGACCNAGVDVGDEGRDRFGFAVESFVSSASSTCIRFWGLNGLPKSSILFSSSITGRKPLKESIEYIISTFKPFDFLGLHENCPSQQWAGYA